MINEEKLARFCEEDKKLKVWAFEKGIKLYVQEHKYYHGINGSILMQSQMHRNQEARADWLEQHKEELIKAGIDWDIIIG